MERDRLPAKEDALSDGFYEQRERDLERRLKRKRYEHSLGVADTSARLAQCYGVDVRKARLAGLLHDWDKDYDDEGIRRRVGELGIAVHPYAFEEMPVLLHGPTAAAALAREFPEIPGDVVRAIELHTTGAVGMTDLDMVVYVADALEPGRRYGSLDELRALEGAVPLEELFLATFQHVLVNLVERRKRVYPETLDVWNHYIARSREAEGAKPEKGTA